MKSYLIILFVFIIALSCSDDNSITPPDETINESASVFILNEGLYGQNNSSITYYDTKSKKVEEDVYFMANNGAFLGDNANDMEIFGERAYITVDNSNKLEVLNLRNFKSEGFIDVGSGGSPREVVIFNSSTGFFTSLYLDKVFKFDPDQKTLTGSLETGSRPEGLVLAGNNLFVANSGFGLEKTVSVISVDEFKIIKTIDVYFNPRFLVNGGDGYVYAVCSGTYTGDGTGWIYKINAASLAKEDSLMVPKNPAEVCLAGDRLLVVNGDGLVSVDLLNFKIGNPVFIAGQRCEHFIRSYLFPQL